ncbi:MAG TPA: SDR family oxidoreductase [Solirubrobacterales bacterium]|nr:SDR family oxidoreductase [Solirubrobacterales bacterium]
MAGLVVVSGASRGIGAATAQRLAAEGRRTVAWARSAGDLREVAEACSRAGAPGLAQTVDVADARSVRAAVAALPAGHAVDGVVLNAGVGAWEDLGETTPEAWRTTIATNLDGAFYTLQALWPRLASRALVVGVGSDSGYEGRGGRAAYCASKFGLRGLLETARIDGGGLELRVSPLACGPVDTHYRGSKPGDRPGALSAAEVAEAVALLFGLPAHVEVPELKLVSVARRK